MNEQTILDKIKLTNAIPLTKPKHNKFLSQEEVKVLLHSDQSLSDNEVVANVVKKQILLENKNMFDPVEYFGGPNIECLDEQFRDERIDKMFKHSYVKQIKTNLKALGARKEKTVSIENKQQMPVNKLQKHKSTHDLLISNLGLKLKAMCSAPQSPGKNPLNKDANKQNIKISFRNQSNANLVTGATKFQQLRLKLKKPSRMF